jgi:hypothetical protein
VATDLDLRLYELFLGKEELLPLWFQLREHIETFGPDIRVGVRDRCAELDRVGEIFVIVEPTAHRRMQVGLHNPGLPTDERFREAVEFGPRRITHRLTLPEDAQIDEDLHARLHTAYMLALEGEPR